MWELKVSNSELDNSLKLYDRFFYMTYKEIAQAQIDYEDHGLFCEIVIHTHKLNESMSRQSAKDVVAIINVLKI